MDSFAWFDETCLPPKDCFFNKMTDSHTTDEEYARAQEIWRDFDCKTLMDFHENYLKSDVTILADCFEQFRDVTYKTHRLDPLHFHTLPGLSWNCMLKWTGIRLDHTADPEIYLFLEDSLRGGVSLISHRYAKANNPEMSAYNPTQPKSFISYLDVN